MPDFHAEASEASMFDFYILNLVLAQPVILDSSGFSKYFYCCRWNSEELGGKSCRRPPYTSLSGLRRKDRPKKLL